METDKPTDSDESTDETTFFLTYSQVQRLLELQSRASTASVMYEDVDDAEGERLLQLCEDAAAETSEILQAAGGVTQAELQPMEDFLSMCCDDIYGGHV